MNKVLFIILSIIVIACGSEDATPTTPINDDFDPDMAVLLRQGDLMGNDHYNVTGTAELYDDNGRIVLLLDNFSSSNGPDLYVYLSTTLNASSFLSLGKLKSVTGKQSYEVPVQTDLSQNKFVLIWCQQFAVQFGNAETL